MNEIEYLLVCLSEELVETSVEFSEWLLSATPKIGASTARVVGEFTDVIAVASMLEDRGVIVFPLDSEVSVVGLQFHSIDELPLWLFLDRLLKTSQEVSKCVRFGVHLKYDQYSKTNLERLRQRFLELLEVAVRIEKKVGVSLVPVYGGLTEQAIIDKRGRLEGFMNISRDRGLLK